MSKEYTLQLNNLGDPISVKVRFSQKAKHIRIIISHTGVELVIPRGAKEKAYKFLLRSERDIRKKMTNFAIPLTCNTGLKPTSITLLDYTYNIKYIDSEHKLLVDMDKNTITVYSPSVSAISVLIQHLQKLALEKITDVVNIISAKHAFKYSKISVKDLKSRWGSCSSKARLSFNWRIILAPTSVFCYVITHELCHLKEPNHQEKFWQLVAQICPTYAISNMWLKKNGYTLYQML